MSPPRPAGSTLVVDGSKERNAGGQGGWRGRSCSTDQLQHLVMAEQLEETVALLWLKSLTATWNINYGMTDCWSETLTSSSGYNIMPYNELWLCFPSLWKELCPEQSHLLAPEGLTPLQCPCYRLFFLKNFHLTVITR